MITKLFQAVSTLTLFILISGIVAAVMTGSSKAFEPAPVFVWLGLMKSGTTEAWDKSGKPREPNPDPIDKVVVKALERGQKATNKVIEKAPVAQTRIDTGKTDARLSICRLGSVDSQNARDLPLALSISFKKLVDSGITYKSLIEVQAKLGMPACNQQTAWRYLASGNRIIDAIEKKDKIEFKFTGF